MIGNSLSVLILLSFKVQLSKNIVMCRFAACWTSIVISYFPRQAKQNNSPQPSGTGTDRRLWIHDRSERSMLWRVKNKKREIVRLLRHSLRRPIQ